MQYKRFNDTFMLRIDCGEEVMQSLAALCEKEGIRLAEVNAIGAADEAVIGVYDLEKQAYYREELSSFMEIASLAGSVTCVDGKPYIHLHTAMVDQQHKVHAGHVIGIRVGATCEMFVRVLDGNVSRERVEELGINIWKF